MTKEVDAATLCIQAHEPVIFWGDPGAGKTKTVEALGKGMDIPVETVIASIREPSDFGGLPIIESGGVRFAPPQWAKNLKKTGGICFIDEISTAPPAVQAALLRVILEGVVGDLSLDREKVSFVAAANPPEHAAGGWELAAPLANRLVHIDWKLDSSDWCDGIIQGFPTPVVTPLPADWRKRIPIHRARVAAFIKARPQLLLAVPDNESAQGKAWPSPRTWDMGSRLLAACESAGREDLSATLVSGCVGSGAAVEYFAWIKAQDLPDPEELLADPSKFKMPDRGDKAYAILASVSAAFVANATVERWDAAWKIMGIAGRKLPDIGAAAARTVAQHRPTGANAPEDIKVFAAMLREAGFIP